MEPLHFAGVDGTGALALPPGIEEEFVKDRWDARQIPGLRYARHTGEYYMNFMGIAEPFCPYVKDYARFLIAADRTVKTIATQVRYLRQFFSFFSERYPAARSLKALREPDIDAFILSLQVYLNAHGGKRGSEFVWRHIHTVEAFLAYLERMESPIKPQEAIQRIIWPHHYPQHARASVPRSQVYSTECAQAARHPCPTYSCNLHPCGAAFASQWVAYL